MIPRNLLEAPHSSLGLVTTPLRLLALVLFLVYECRFTERCFLYSKCIENTRYLLVLVRLGIFVLLV